MVEDSSWMFEELEQLRLSEEVNQTMKLLT